MKNPLPGWMESWTCRTRGFTHSMAGLSIAGLSMMAMLSATDPVLANEQSGPWECSGYSGDAHTRCLNAFIEVQQEKISKLEGELRTQQSSVNELRDRVDRQRAATADLERQMSDRLNAERFYAPPLAPFYSYSYSYPSVGFGLYLGSPWYYGSPYLYRPFGPSFYFGPRFFGHRHFGCRGRC
jgi:hypothetical protein